MAPRADRSEEDPSHREIVLANVPGRGLGYYDKNSKLVMVTEVNLQLIGTTFCSKFGIKANVWGAKYNQAKGQKIWRLVVPKEYELNPRKFSHTIDKQSGEDSGFLIRNQSLWIKFVHHQEDKMRDTGDRVRFIMAESTGFQDQAVTWQEDRGTERYVFGYNSMFDHNGKKLSPVDCVFFPQLSLKKDAVPLLKAISVVPGGRDVFAQVIRVATPDNFYACLLSLAASFGLFHGKLLRRVTAGQLPVLCLKSLQRGKSQGKSGVGRLITKCVSSWEKNKISARMNIQTIKKRMSFTTLPIYVDDVKDDKFLAKMVEGFDDGECYETNEGEFVRRAELIFSANYFGIDEDAGDLDGERILDRIAAIPFDEWEDIPAGEFAAKQRRFKQVIDCPKKPTELLIGEMGDFIRSEEFTKKREELATYLHEKTEECIKIRTLSTNYSSFYAILWKIHIIFQPVWEEMDASWPGFLSWVETVHAPFLMQQHQEKDHSKHSIRRYINDVLGYVLTWSMLDRRKILKICETRKLKNGDKYCLAFHPSPRYVDFQEMGGVRLKDLKSHTNAIGGAWGEDTWAAMVRDSCEAVLDTTEDAAAGLEDTQAKRALLIPLSVFTSTQIIKIATQTGQTEDFKKFGVDEETPSGVEDVRNSTQMSRGSSYHLVLSDVSSIQGPSDQDEGPEILFDELERPTTDDFVVEESNMSLTMVRENDVGDGSTMTDNTAEEDSGDDDINFDNVSKRASLSRTLKNKTSSRNITVVETSESTFFVCPCGFSSTNRSGTSRHKCRNTADVPFACSTCTKVCKNPGSLKRHIQTMHKNRQSVSLPALSVRPNQSQIIQEFNQHQCLICSKILKTSKTLKTHIEKVHSGTSKVHDVSAGSALDDPVASVDVPAETVLDATASTNQCFVCAKILKTSTNLKTHIEKVHGGSTITSPLEVSVPTVPASDSSQANVIDQTALSSNAPGVPTKQACIVCGKVLANEKNLANHIKKVHGYKDALPESTEVFTSGVDPSTSTAEPLSTSAKPTPQVPTLARRRRSVSAHKSKTSARRK